MSHPNLPRVPTWLRPPRRWMQFRLRTLLVAVTAACVLLSLLTKPIVEARKERAAIEALRKAGAGDISTNTVRYPGFGLFRQVLGNSIYLRASHISLKGPSVVDADLRRLRDLEHLKMLDLGDSGVTDAGLAYLKGLTHLERLYLNGTQITDAGLEHLQAMTKLESLDVFGTQVTYDGLTRLDQVLPRGSFAEQRAIEEIQAVGGQAVTYPETLEEEDRLTRYSAARYLHLDGATMSGDAMPHVRYLRSLREARLAALRPGDEDLAPLAGLPKLETLEIWLTDVDENDLMHLGRIGSLRELSFHHSEMTDAGLEHLAHLDRLRELEFHQTHVTEEGVEPLRKALPKCHIEVRRDY